MKTIAIVAGESSGDLLGSHLIKSLKSTRSDLKFIGIAGPKMVKEGALSYFPMEELSVRGYFEAFKKLFHLLKLRKNLLKKILDAKPNGINAEGLKRRGFDPAIIAKIKEAYKILYRQGLSLGESQEKIKLLSKDAEALNLYIDFIAKSTRGIIR